MAAYFVYDVDSNLVWCYTVIYIIKLGGDRLKKKREKPEDFIGWKSSDGKLEVRCIIEKSKNTTFKVTCTECSKDTELFPDGYFVSTKSNLVKGKKPCGCSKQPKWKSWQYLILARRAGEKKNFIVHGFAEEFKNQNTKLNLECLKDGHTWRCTIDTIINKSTTGCPLCGNKKIGSKLRHSQYKVDSDCKEICQTEGYKFLGFIGKYTNWLSVLEYECPYHGVHEVTYNNFIRGKRCPCCASYGYNPSKSGSFYVARWQHKDKKFIKFGITNREVLTRIEEQSDKTAFEYELVFSASFTDGSIPLRIEKEIKACPEIIKTYISKEEFPDGFTETTYIINLVVLENLITDALCILANKKV